MRTKTRTDVATEFEQQARRTEAHARGLVQLRAAGRDAGLQPTTLDAMEGELAQLGERCTQSERSGVALDRSAGNDRPMKPLSGDPGRVLEDSSRARRFETVDDVILRWGRRLTGVDVVDAVAQVTSESTPAAPTLSPEEAEHVRLRREATPPGPTADLARGVSEPGGR